ncbi:replication initiator protein A [Amorphus sp. 3PC139-8]|uniref:replication initiator protein A n=1 Tax=Amorphus sp. 3PC139-8 TaxID=2735676 RepID=UPI00345DD14D
MKHAEKMGERPKHLTTLKQTQERLRKTVPGATPVSSLGTPPANDNQLDFFVPALHDIPVKDGVGLMDIAVFRLSRRQRRNAEILRHETNKAVIEVSSGAYGMATIDDYDIVLMAISHLADAVKRYRQGRGPKPGKVFRPHSAEVLKFRRSTTGGKQYADVERALDRLNTTRIKITGKNRHSRLRDSDGFGLIERYRVVSRTDTGRIGLIEITIPDWIYDGVMTHKTPEILTVNPDYFLIRGGLARFIYRLARKAAGVDTASYSFRSIYARSGSTRQYRKFCFDLRCLIAANDLPDYRLTEIQGQDGPMLHMAACFGTPTLENRATDS